jgi:hypothetical protein
MYVETSDPRFGLEDDAKASRRTPLVWSRAEMLAWPLNALGS